MPYLSENVIFDIFVLGLVHSFSCRFYIKHGNLVNIVYFKP